MKNSIIFDNQNKITEVRYRDTALSVKFEAVVIKEDSGNKLTGLVSTSSLKVYTTLYNKDIVNIIHIHLNDTSDEIAVDSVFLERNCSVNDYKHFLIDSMGKKLNYKFLFRDYKLIKIFNNLSPDFIDEPEFEEIRFNKQTLIKVTSGSKYINYFGRVINIPIGMLARKDKDDSDILERLKSYEINMDGYCPERHLEELPGFVDVEIIFAPYHTVLEKPIRVSMPVCKVVPLTPKEEANFQKTILKNKYKKVENLYQRYVGYENYLNDLSALSKLSLAEMKQLMSEMKVEVKKEEYISAMDDSENIEVRVIYL